MSTLGKYNISSPKNSWVPRCAELDESKKNINAQRFGGVAPR